MSVQEFMEQYPDRVSLFLQVEDEAYADQKPNQVLPLASTIKMLLVADAMQMLSRGELDKDLKIPLESLERFHLPGTDGGAHMAWLAGLEQEASAVPELVDFPQLFRGILMYSSNANTEFLIRLMGRERMETLAERWEVDLSTAPYPFVGSILIPQYLQDNEQVPQKDLPSALRALSADGYADLAWAMSDSLAMDEQSAIKENFKLSGLAAQKVWSERLVGSSARQWADLAFRFNRRSALSPYEQENLIKTHEFIMQSPGNQRLYQHAGLKGGSTGFLLSQCAYATTLEGERIELVYFLFNLNPLEVRLLSQKLNDFDAAILSDASAREELAKLFPPDNE